MDLMDTPTHPQEPRSSRPRFRFSISAILGILTIGGVLLGWYADHQRLTQQIPTESKVESRTFSLKNASRDLAVAKLIELFPEQSIRGLKGTNFVLVLAERKTQNQIGMVLRYIDRVDTEFVGAVDPPTLASESEVRTDLN